MDTPGRPFMPRQLGLGNNCLAQEKKKRNVKNCHLFAFPQYGYPLQSNCNRRMPVPLQKSVQANGSPHRGFFFCLAGGIACLTLYRGQSVMQQLGTAISLRTER